MVAFPKASQNTQVSLKLNKPDDKVRFESVSNMRSHVRCVVELGSLPSREMSDGMPHLIINISGV
ncbi:glyoxalase superfamily protein [Yoonia sp. MH D7]